MAILRFPLEIDLPIFGSKSSVFVMSALLCFRDSTYRATFAEFYLLKSYM